MLWSWLGGPACVPPQTCGLLHVGTGSPLACAVPADSRPLVCTGTSHSKRFSFRGHKRKLNDEDAASESSRESSCEDEEGSSSEADEMAAALEAELDLM